ncbi:MAG: histidinol-phosphatase [Bacilli bacterium]|nr:histidinol-phosphatase [Bacilli bacterium]
MIDYNYHTHTSRCGHAHGTEREYIEAAIARGIKVLGFSDHILIESKNEETKAKLYDYIKTINELKEEYKDKIEIHLGFECEHFDDRVDYYKYLLKEKGIEYLILGQHYITDKHGKRLDMFDELDNPHEIAKRYYLCVKEGLKSGLYVYLAHPDLYTREFKEIDKVYLKYAKKICKAAKHYHVPIELNLNGLYYKKLKNISISYPCEEFFEIAGKVRNDVMVGIDAHSPELITNADYEWAESIINKYHLHTISRLNLKK